MTPDELNMLALDLCERIVDRDEMRRIVSAMIPAWVKSASSSPPVNEGVLTFAGGAAVWKKMLPKSSGAAEPGQKAYVNVIVPIYYGVNDVSDESAAFAASTKYWVEIDEDAATATLESGSTWGTPTTGVSIWRVIETDADSKITYYRQCWEQANPSTGWDLRAMDIVETSV